VLPITTSVTSCDPSHYVTTYLGKKRKNEKKIENDLGILAKS